MRSWPTDGDPLATARGADLNRFRVINTVARLQRDVGLSVVRLAPERTATADRFAPVIDHPHLVDFDLEYRLDRLFDRVLAGAVRHAEGEHLAIAFDRLFILAVTDVFDALIFHIESLLRDHRRFEHIPNC